MILRIAKRIAFSDIVQDERSEYSDDEKATESTKEKKERMKDLMNGSEIPGVMGSGPTVLLNGMPVQEDEHVTIGASTGMKKAPLPRKRRGD